MGIRTFIDLFAGCGGLSLGLIKSGMRGVFAIEKNSDAFSTLKHNLIDGDRGNYEWPEWLPCKAMKTSDLLSKYRGKLKDLRGKIDVVAGGPPCQGFSFAGRRNSQDPRNKLTEEYIEIVNILRPKFLILENVKGFTSAFSNSDERPYSETVVETLEQLGWGGYKVFDKMLNASVFGVPQPRPRFILLAIRADLVEENLSNPFDDIEEFAKEFRNARSLNGHEITVKEAISDLRVSNKKLVASEDSKGFVQIKYKAPKKLSEFQVLMRDGLKNSQSPNSLRLARHKPETRKRFEKVLAECPKGKSLSKEFREKLNMKKQCFTPLHPDQISKTITTLPDDLLHYDEPRILTVRENARLQTFPDWFEFKGKYTTGGPRRKIECPRYTQVGNAVPPLMAEALGEILQGIRA